MIAYVRGTLAYVDPEEGSAVVESCVSILIFR